MEMDKIAAIRATFGPLYKLAKEEQEESFFKKHKKKILGLAGAAALGAGGYYAYKNRGSIGNWIAGNKGTSGSAPKSNNPKRQAGETMAERRANRPAVDPATVSNAHEFGDSQPTHIPGPGGKLIPNPQYKFQKMAALRQHLMKVAAGLMDAANFGNRPLPKPGTTLRPSTLGPKASPLNYALDKEKIKRQLAAQNSAGYASKPLQKMAAPLIPGGQLKRESRSAYEKRKALADRREMDILLRRKLFTPKPTVQIPGGKIKSSNEVF